MCGIVGLLPKAKNGFTYVQQKMFLQMLQANEIRGADATGVIAVENNGDFTVMREASSAYFFAGQFDNSQADKDMFHRGSALIGHNRAKTVGANKDENAHPFTIDKTFSMVHNGTLRNHHELGKHEVDSESLAHLFKEAMDQEDWKTALEDAMGKVRGAYAVVWYDQKRNQVCMMRNSERPLGYIETDSSIMFGSELGLVSWIAQRNNDKIKEWIYCDVHALYTFDLKEGNGAVQKTNLSLPLPKAGAKSYSVTPASGAATTTGPTTKPTPLEEKGSTHPALLAQPMSKNVFKRLRANCFRKDITFEVEDYIEASGGNYLIMGASYDGAYDICEQRHFIRANINLGDLGLEESDFWNQTNIQMRGTVADVEYDKVLKLAVLIMENVNVVQTIH